MLYFSFLTVGLFFIILAWRISVTFCIEFVSENEVLSPKTEKEIHFFRLISLSIGLVTFLLTYILKRNKVLESLFKDKSFSTKDVLLNSLLLFVSITVGLALVEVVLRVVGYEKFKVELPNPERAIFWHYDSLLGWKHLPNHDGRFIMSDFDIHVKINGQGLRDRPYSYQRQKGVFRIVVLGDSFTWGFGVEQDQIFTEIIERSQDNLEVINMGVSGYSTDQEYLLLKEEGLKYQPQLIMLMFFDNDIYENSLAVNYFIYPKPKFSIVNAQLVLTNRPLPKVSPLRKVHYFLRTHLITYNVLVRVLSYNQTKPIRLSRKLASGITLWLTGKKKENPFELTCAIISELKALSETCGAQLVIVKIATQDQALDFDNTKPNELAEYCHAQNIPFLDLAEPFQDYLRSDNNHSLQFANDRHWNVNAHNRAARVIHSYLQSKGLIPAR
ncbi:MAG: SGNH/GDSL hydrolase family protein [Candidatus Hodarchaeota archaeon]